MDGRRFDLLTKTLTPNGSRRSVLRTLTGGTLGAVLGGLGLREASACIGRGKKKCSRDNQCCGAGDFCRSNHCAGYPSKVCCGLKGTNCQVDCNCCGNLYCRSGKCAA